MTPAPDPLRAGGTEHELEELFTDNNGPGYSPTVVQCVQTENCPMSATASTSPPKRAMMSAAPRP